MLPIGNGDSDRRTVPFITYGLIAVNVLFFTVELGSGDDFIEKWAFIPNRFLANPLTDFLNLFTAMFMHAGWLHLAGNMLCLWIFGDNVEDRFGHVKFLIFYLICGLAATFAMLAVSSGSYVPNLGASGAIAGVFGAYILLFPQGKVRVTQQQRVIQLPAQIVLGFWIVLQFFVYLSSITGTALMGGIASMANIGGFVIGSISTFLFRANRGLLALHPRARLGSWSSEGVNKQWN